VADPQKVYALAAKIAKRRHPNGAGATVLSAIVREAARELGYMGKRNASSPRLPNPNEGRHNRLELLSSEEQIEAQKICRERTASSASPSSAPCTDRGFVCYACQDWAAQAIEARMAETGNTGSVHESAGPQDDAHA
jgi:hypothetical protein